MAQARFVGALSADALDQLEILGENIRLARRARGWSIAAAAERFSMSTTTLQNIEKGDPKASIGAYLAALDVMGIAEGLSSLGASHRDPVVRRFR